MRRHAPLWLLVALAGCDDTAFPAKPMPDYEANWTDIQAFTLQQCGSCHTGATVVALPDYLEDDHRADVDRNQPEGTCFPDLTWENDYLVVPCNPEASEFWRVLSAEARRECGAGDNDNECDLLMPATGDLPDDQIEFVREWILAGAPL